MLCCAVSTDSLGCLCCLYLFALSCPWVSPLTALWLPFAASICLPFAAHCYLHRLPLAALAAFNTFRLAFAALRYRSLSAICCPLLSLSVRTLLPFCVSICLPSTEPSCERLTMCACLSIGSACSPSLISSFQAVLVHMQQARVGTNVVISMSLYLGIDVTYCACNVNRSMALVKEQQKFYPR